MERWRGRGRGSGRESGGGQGGRESNIYRPLFFERERERAEEVTEERHIRHLEIFFTAAAERIICFKLTKCRWAMPEVELLGFRVGGGVEKMRS